MDTETLALLGQSSDLPEPDPDPGPEAGSPEAVIARGEIPEGYIRDRVTGEIRRKKRPGRQRGGTAAPRPDTPLNRTADEAPDSKARGKRRQPVPRYQKGVIAAGMTKLYRQTGKIIRAMDRDIGIAVIECAEDCGEAWDELARTNPRVRRFLMQLIKGGAWGQIIMAHMPIFLAVIMKDGIRKHIPFMKLITAATETDEDGPSQIADLLGGMSAEDMQQMMTVAQSMMGNIANGMTAKVVNNDE